MTRLLNDFDDFVDEMVDGFVMANQTLVRRVEGGVVRRDRPPGPNVAVVTGGGAGHFPAFAGYVGEGLAAAAVTGNIFASPSAQQIYRVALAADDGAGVLFCYGNYAGDVLNFDDAQERLRREEIECRTVRVTDDVMSAAPSESGRRRGIAGDLFVLKIAGAAAAKGLSLAEVERLSRKANDQCRSMGVAFDGCTLPGAAHPLFTVPAGRMAVGLGIHGEPGLDDRSIPTADELAELLVTTLVKDYAVADRGGRVAVLVNGLGTVTYEELYVVYRSVHRSLVAQGVDILDAAVGEFVTSFDMAGLSLSLLWVDDELEDLWFAPAVSVGYTRTAGAAHVIAKDQSDPASSLPNDIASTSHTQGSEASQRSAGVATEAFRIASVVLDAHTKELGDLDAIAGDGDHGIGMQRGSRAAYRAAQQAQAAGFGARATVEQAATAWADRGGGTSGALWGAALQAFAGHLSDQSFPTPSDIADGLSAAAAAVSRVGGAAVGDKTMLDPLSAVATSFRASILNGQSLPVAWRNVADAASRSARSTASMLPNAGRARTHGARSLGIEDPGAYSLALVVSTVVEQLAATD